MSTKTWTNPTADATYDGNYISDAGGKWTLKTSSASYPSTLKAYWKLDETAGTRADATSNGYDLANDADVGYATGKFGNAAHFVNASAHRFYESTGTDDLDWGGTYSTGQAVGALSCWFKATSGSVARTLATSGGSWAIRLGGDDEHKGEIGILIVRGDNTQWWNWTGTGNTYDDNAWHHLVVSLECITYAGTDLWLHVYLDNQLIINEYDNFNNTVHTAGYLNISQKSGGRTWNGDVDDFGLWKGAILDTGDVSALYNSGTGASIESVYGTPGYYTNKPEIVFRDGAPTNPSIDSTTNSYFKLGSFESTEGGTGSVEYSYAVMWGPGEPPAENWSAWTNKAALQAAGGKHGRYLWLKARLVSDGTQTVDLDDVSMGYDPGRLLFSWTDAEDGCPADPSAVDETGDKWSLRQLAGGSEDLRLLLQFEDTGESAVSGRDDSRYSNDATVNGTVQLATGKVGSAADFDGSTGYVQVPDSASLEPGAGDFTMSFWIRCPNPWSGYEPVLFRGASYAARSVSIRMSKTNLAWFFADDQHAAVNSRVIDLSGYYLRTGVWHRVTIVRTYDDGGTSTYRTYIHGIDPMYAPAAGLVDTITGQAQVNITDTTCPWLVGKAKDSGENDEFFYGWLDDFAIWQAALTSEQVNQVAHATGGVFQFDGFIELPDSLKLLAQMEESPGSTRFDRTRNDNDLADSGTVGRTAGIVGAYAADFDGTDDFLSSAGFPNCSQNLTITGWFKIDTTIASGRVPLVSRLCQESPAQYAYWVGVRGGMGTGSDEMRLHATLSGDNVGSVAITGRTSLSVDTWYFFAVTYDFDAGSPDADGGQWGRMTLYMGRQSYAVYEDGANPYAPKGLWTSSQPLHVGRDADAYWNGPIDDLSIWNQALRVDQLEGIRSADGGVYGWLGGGEGAGTVYPEGDYVIHYYSGTSAEPIDAKQAGSVCDRSRWHLATFRAKEASKLAVPARYRYAHRSSLDDDPQWSPWLTLAQMQSQRPGGHPYVDDYYFDLQGALQSDGLHAITLDDLSIEYEHIGDPVEPPAPPPPPELENHVVLYVDDAEVDTTAMRVTVETLRTGLHQVRELQFTQHKTFFEPDFAYDQCIEVYVNDTRRFYGWIKNIEFIAEPDDERIRYTAYGLRERCASFIVTDPLSNAYLPRVVFNAPKSDWQDYQVARSGLTTGEIIKWLFDRYNKTPDNSGWEEYDKLVETGVLETGGADDPGYDHLELQTLDVVPPKIELREVTFDQAIQQVLCWQPDCVYFWTSVKDIDDEEENGRRRCRFVKLSQLAEQDVTFNDEDWRMLRAGLTPSIANRWTAVEITGKEKLTNAQPSLSCRSWADGELRYHEYGLEKFWDTSLESSWSAEKSRQPYRSHSGQLDGQGDAYSDTYIKDASKNWSTSMSEADSPSDGLGAGLPQWQYGKVTFWWKKLVASVWYYYTVSRQVRTNGSDTLYFSSIPEFTSEYQGGFPRPSSISDIHYSVRWGSSEYYWVFRRFRISDATKRRMAPYFLRYAAESPDYGQGESTAKPYMLFSYKYYVQFGENWVPLLGWRRIYDMELYYNDGVIVLNDHRWPINHNNDTSSWKEGDRATYTFIYAYRGDPPAVRYPASGYEGTAYTDAGVERTKKILDEDFVEDTSPTVARYQALAEQALRPLKDIIYEGDIPLACVNVSFADEAYKVNLTGLDAQGNPVTTGFESLRAVVFEAKYDFTKNTTRLTVSTNTRAFDPEFDRIKKERFIDAWIRNADHKFEIYGRVGNLVWPWYVGVY